MCGLKQRFKEQHVQSSEESRREADSVYIGFEDVDLFVSFLLFF